MLGRLARGRPSAAQRCADRAARQRQDGPAQLVQAILCTAQGGGRRRLARADGHPQSQAACRSPVAAPQPCQAAAQESRRRVGRHGRVVVGRCPTRPRRSAGPPLSPQTACGSAGRSPCAGWRRRRDAAQREPAGSRRSTTLSARARGHARLAVASRCDGRLVLESPRAGRARHWASHQGSRSRSVDRTLARTRRDCRCGRFGHRRRPQPSVSVLRPDLGRCAVAEASSDWYLRK